MKPLRVTHVLEAAVGGTARHVADIGCGLARAGFAVEVIVSLRRDEDFAPKAGRLAAAGAAVTEIPMAREIAPGEDLRALARLYRHLRATRPDVVHAHSSKAGILGRAAAAWAGVPTVVYSPHAFAFQMRGSRARRALYLALERCAGRRTHRLVAVSQSEADLAIGARVLPKERVVVIENGVDPAEAAPPEAGAAVRRELGIPADATVVLFAGRLVEQKAPEVMVAAALSVLAAHPKAVFLLAGEGPLRPQLAAAIGGAAEHVRLLGYRADVPSLCAAAQVFALPSRWEGLPYAPLEAMNAGLPVVAANLPPLREIVAAGETGVLVPLDDPEALAAALAGLLARPDRARAMGEAGRQRVRARYTLARQVEHLAELYRALARISLE